MTIELKDVISDLGLTEEQMDKINDVQEKFNTVYSTAVDAEKQGILNKNQELLNKLALSKEKQIPDGFDMDSYNEYVTNKDQIIADKLKAEENALIASENWNKLKNDMSNKHEETINSLKNESSDNINSLRSALDNELIENVTLKEIEKVEGSQVLLMPHIKQSIKTYMDENGRYLTKVVDSLGNDRLNTETGNPMTVAELVSEFQANESFSGAFPIRNKGSRTTVSVGGKTFNATNNPFDKKSKHYSITEQAKLNRTNPELAKTLKSAAN